MNYRIHSGQDSEFFKKGYTQGAKELLSFYKERLLSTEKKEDERLFRVYSLNFLLRSYAHSNGGFFNFLKFLERCRQQEFIRYRDFFYIDARGAISLISIVFKSRKIIDGARWLRNSFQS